MKGREAVYYFIPVCASDTISIRKVLINAMEIPEKRRQKVPLIKQRAKTTKIALPVKEIELSRPADKVKNRITKTAWKSQLLRPRKALRTKIGSIELLKGSDNGFQRCPL